MATAHEYVGLWVRGFQPSPLSYEASHYPGDITDSSDLAALYFEGGGEGHSLSALNCTLHVFTDRTKLQINLYPLENQSRGNNDSFKSALKSIIIQNISTTQNKHVMNF